MGLRVLAVVPARGGSKGLPGKNIRPIAGMPLIAHSLRCAALCPEITRCVVSTDSDEIAAAARAHGGDVPFMRPAELAGDSVAMMPVLQHALETVEAQEGARYDALLLLDPTSPGRTPDDVSRAVQLLTDRADADGVVACSEPTFNPFWVGVTDREGWMTQAIPTGQFYTRRQDVPRFLRINGALYLWRRDFLLRAPSDWLRESKNVVLEIPEERALSIDTLHEFRMAELMMEHGLIALPWLAKGTT